jgi:hypothetical protein
MSIRNPLALMALGSALMIAGFLVIFLMVLRVLQPGFTLSFLAYGASFLGLLLGIVGVVEHAGSRR